jgi:hypothetical protein
MARFIVSKSVRLPTLIAPTVMPQPVSNKGASIVPAGDRLAPIRLTCPLTAKAFSDFAMGSRPADLDDAIDAAAAGQLARLLVPIRRLGIIDHFGGPQRLEPLGFFRCRGRRDHSGTRKLGELQRKDRNAPRTLPQDRVAGGHSTVVGQCDPGDHRGASRSRISRRGGGSAQARRQALPGPLSELARTRVRIPFGPGRGSSLDPRTIHRPWSKHETTSFRLSASRHNLPGWHGSSWPPSPSPWPGWCASSLGGANTAGGWMQPNEHVSVVAAGKLRKTGGYGD